MNTFWYMILGEIVSLNYGYIIYIVILDEPMVSFSEWLAIELFVLLLDAIDSWLLLTSSLLFVKIIGTVDLPHFKVLLTKRREEREIGEVVDFF
jgi:hypothetical protein